MLGGGNPVSANPAGTGSNINYIGDHAYLHSGVVGVDNNVTTLFECDIANNQYIVAELQIFNGTLSNEDIEYNVLLNGEVIVTFTCQLVSNEDFITHDPINLILVGGSKLKVTAQNLVSSTPRNHTTILTGRVYA